MYFLLTILQHYSDIVECLPDNFLFKCCKYALHPNAMECITIPKLLLKVMPPNDFKNFIEMLTIETVSIKL